MIDEDNMSESKKTCKVLIELPQYTLECLDTFAKEHHISRSESIQLLLDLHQQKIALHSSQLHEFLLHDLKNVYDQITSFQNFDEIK